MMDDYDYDFDRAQAIARLALLRATISAIPTPEEIRVLRGAEYDAFEIDAEEVGIWIAGALWYRDKMIAAGLIKS